MNIQLMMLMLQAGLPRDGLASAFLVKNNLVDDIGLSSIELTTGTIEDLPNATWGFPSDAVTLQADSDMGGGVMFDPENDMAPFVRSGAEWYALFNDDFAWMGFHAIRGGVVFYNITKAAQATRIQNYLGRYSPVVSFDELTTEQMDALTEEQFDALSA